MSLLSSMFRGLLAASAGEVLETASVALSIVIHGAVLFTAYLASCRGDGYDIGGALGEYCYCTEYY